MPLPNRVDPFGVIQAHAGRGLLTGNRGVIHDPETRTLLRRRWTTRAWIACALNHKGVRRTPMGRNARSGSAGWTELFFLDEVTALAAGHRPCFLCRRAAAAAFAASLGRAWGEVPRAEAIDRALHRERLASGGPPHAVTKAEAASLPDGAVIAAGETAWAKRGAGFLAWSFEGYGTPSGSDALGHPLRLVTPASVLSALTAGYPPLWHPSAGD